MTFVVVNVSVLVLRRDPVDHDHFRVPGIVPVLGCVVSLLLLLHQDAASFARAGAVLALGVVLWLAGRLAAAR